MAISLIFLLRLESNQTYSGYITPEMSDSLCHLYMWISENGESEVRRNSGLADTGMNLLHCVLKSVYFRELPIEDGLQIDLRCPLQLFVRCMAITDNLTYRLPSAVSKPIAHLMLFGRYCILFEVLSDPSTISSWKESEG